MGKKFEIKDGDISDGYHTFDELYEHRCLLFIGMALDAFSAAAWKRDHYEGWDCIYLETGCGQISYHVPSRLRKYYEGAIKEDPNYKYDGHTSTDVLERLRKCLEDSLLVR